MSGSSPSDLAVAFRSIPRRRSEALGELSPTDEAVVAISGDLEAAISGAASVLHCPADPTAIADAIDHRPPDSWTDDELDALRRLALDVGGLLRLLERVAEDRRDA